MSETNNDVNKNNILMKVRQKGILQIIFDNLSLNKYLNIIRYNKSIQKKVEININDYKNEYFKIEIELIPSTFSLDFSNRYNKFINLQNKNVSYYHIFLMIINKK